MHGNAIESMMGALRSKVQRKVQRTTHRMLMNALTNQKPKIEVGDGALESMGYMVEVGEWELSREEVADYPRTSTCYSTFQ